MTDNGYRKRLAADLPKWREAGWVTEEGAGQIMASFNVERRGAFGVVAVLGTLGALLLGLGVVAFVGSNWEEIPRLYRLGLIVAALAVAYVAAFAFERRSFRVFAEAALLAAGLIYVGAVALVGQTYHLSGDMMGALLLFEAGILAAAVFTGSVTMTVVALGGAVYWVWGAVTDFDINPHWPSLVAILIGMAVVTHARAYYSRIAAVIALMVWIGVTVGGFADAQNWEFAGGMMVYAAVALAFWALGAALAATKVLEISELGEAMLWPGLLAILVAIGGLQFATEASVNEQPAMVTALICVGLAVVLTAVALLQKGVTLIDLLAVAILGIGAVGFALAIPEDDLGQRLAGGVLALVAALWAVTLGQSGRHPIGKVMGLVAFGLEVIYLYVRTLGTLLDTAVAFLLGGILFVILAVVLYRVERMLAGRAAPPAAPPGAPPAPVVVAAGTPPVTGSAP